MFPYKNEEIVLLRNNSTELIQIPKIEVKKTYQDFFLKHLLPNYPCILSTDFTKHWKSRKEWCLTDGSPIFEFLHTRFGNACVPVANCKKEKYGSHPKSEMTIHDFMSYWEKYKQTGYPEDMDCLYLKDFHFNREFPDYKAYETPGYFTSDWMNEYWDQRNEIWDDYRFVYMGPKGSWTPFHADVFRSFSWSANVCGKKKWIFFPPGEEECLKDVHGQLVFDVNSEDLKNPQKYPKFTKLKHRIEVTQLPGEVIFVPSGWHHQVFNLEDTISINHNWLNGCNVDISWNFLKQGLTEVEKEIQDVKDSKIVDGDWYQHCQIMLKADIGINFPEFFDFMRTIVLPRIEILKQQTKSTDAVENETSHMDTRLSTKGDITQTVARLLTTPHLLNTDCILFDIHRVKYILEDMWKNEEFANYDKEINGQHVKQIEELISTINESVECCDVDM